MDGQATDLDSLIGSIYDCAVDPGRWPEALARVAQRLDCSYAALHAFAKQPAWQVDAVYHSPWDAQRLATVVQYLGDIPALDELIGGPLDRPIATLERVPFAQIRTSAFYREWVEPQGLHDACLTKVGESANRIVQFSVVNSVEQGAISRQQQALVVRLAPHIRRAIMIGDLAQRQQTRLDGLQAALDALACGVLLTNDSRRVLHANAAAQAMLVQGGPLRLRDGRLTASRPDIDAALAEALRRAHRGDPALGVRGIGIPLRAGPGHAGACSVCYVLPLNCSDARQVAGAATVAVYLAAGSDALPVLGAVLATLFGLTPAEAHLARLACDGRSVAALAQQLGVSVNTVKTHLKRVFDKTGVQRRSELVAMLASLLPPVAVPAWQAASASPPLTG